MHKQVATLVAEAFLPNHNNLSQVNHKDENKTNNFVWVKVNPVNGILFSEDYEEYQK